MFKPTDGYLLGYYGKQNTGDDALLYATAWAMRTFFQCDKLKVNIFGDSQYDDVAKSQGPVLFKGHARMRHYHIAAASKRLIIGGGSVFHSERDIQLKRHLIGLANRKKSMAVGVSLGPFESVAAERACQRFLNECGFIGVRDQHTLELANHLAPEANVKLTFDLAPVLLRHKQFSPLSIPRKGVAFNFCQRAINPFGETDVQEEQQRISKACKVIHKVWQQTHEPVYLLDLNGHPLFGDHLVHKQILARLPDDVAVTHLPYCPNPLKLLQTLYKFKSLVCMRLHAAIFGYLTHTPTFVLNYHEKCRSWAEQIGLSQKYLFDANTFIGEEVAEALLGGLEHGFSSPTLEVQKSVEKSMLNWSEHDDAHSVFGSHTPLQQA